MGFVAIDNEEVKKLKKQVKPLTKFEAVAVLTYDLNFNKIRPIAEYRRLFGWGSREKVRNFINRHATSLISNGSEAHTAMIEKQNRQSRAFNGEACERLTAMQGAKLPF